MSALKQRVLSAAAAVVATGTLSLGVTGANLIQSSEGTIYKAYRDPVGIITACTGHTSPYLRMGMTFTKAECDLLFKSDVIKHQKVIIGKGNCIKDAPLNPNQIDAVTSLVFNIGTGNFCKSTLARKLSARDYAGAAKEFPKWKYAGGKVLPGLVIRRSKERALFNSRSTWVSWDLGDLVVLGASRAEDHR